ncbi:hypothetical protein N657DRAFT_642352 [Parathielavia appendiculata]|uniref:F-box domain-containing protein n=1 Tax=Parathielavia appendiculata TaxID=2587402 RepID=A0AAN6U374_9PEZI|nr:hypothetical protein N657DRAFT_642352 [Parathielavia appendiculata]
MKPNPSLGCLPNELLIFIFSHLPTTNLLPLGAVSHRFYSVTLLILKQRLGHVLSTPDRRLMLECYHPAEKLYTPYLYCNYLYTDSFADLEAGATASQSHAASDRIADWRSGLRGIYSHFRPVEHDEDHNDKNRPRRGRYSQGRAQSCSSAVDAGAGGGGDDDGGGLYERPSIDVHLDDCETFTQLCTVTNLVHLGPRPGLFRSHVNVSDRVVCVSRDWLAAQATMGWLRQRQQRRAAGGVKAQAEEEVMEGDDGVLWVDVTGDVGLRFRVSEKDIHAEHPVLVAMEEELPVAYRLEFEELLVRSTTLLTVVERSEAQQLEVAAEAKAIVLAAF